VICLHHVENYFFDINILKFFSDFFYFDYVIKCSEYEKPCLREVAVKSILKLATRWDSYISPKMFCLTIMRAKVCLF
jgi:hypothetical protein